MYRLFSSSLENPDIESCENLKVPSRFCCRLHVIQFSQLKPAILQRFPNSTKLRKVLQEKCPVIPPSWQRLVSAGQRTEPCQRNDERRRDGLKGRSPE